MDICDYVTVRNACSRSELSLTIFWSAMVNESDAYYFESSKIFVSVLPFWSILKALNHAGEKLNMKVPQTFDSDEAKPIQELTFP